jgi:hypothetical protein
MSSGPNPTKWRRLPWLVSWLALTLLPLPVQAAPRRGAQAAAAQAPTDPVVETPSSDDNVLQGTGTTGEQAGRPIEINVWGRLGNNVIPSGPGGADAFVDAEVDLLLGGRVHPKVGWQADFVATYGPGNFGPGADNGGRAQILDLIVKFDLAESFNVWFGRMLVPSDRSNLSGPWFMSPWYYPGAYLAGAAPVGPRAGAFGRSDGFTLWGQLDEGVIKYFAGVYDLGTPADSPLYSARVNLNLWNPEPGYYHSSTYYGERDVASVGVNAQYKKNGSLAPASPPTSSWNAPCPASAPSTSSPPSTFSPVTTSRSITTTTPC